jgi:hypothetical protein
MKNQSTSKLVLSKQTLCNLSVRTGVKAGTACTMNNDCTTQSAVVNCVDKTLCCPKKIV